MTKIANLSNSCSLQEVHFKHKPNTYFKCQIVYWENGSLPQKRAKSPMANLGPSPLKSLTL